MSVHQASRKPQIRQSIADYLSGSFRSISWNASRHLQMAIPNQRSNCMSYLGIGFVTEYRYSQMASRRHLTLGAQPSGPITILMH